MFFRFKLMRSQQTEIRARQILVVDDEPMVCGAIKMMLEHDGHEVQTVGSGKEALSLLEHDGFDVVITDYSMPEMRGDALAAAIKQRLPNQPVLMITAHADVLKSSGNPLTAVNFLMSKPFLLEDLRAAVARVLPRVESRAAEEFKSEHWRSDGGIHG
jgi:CheY-like chemotaxis protein